MIKQFFVLSFRLYQAVIDDKNSVGGLNRGEPVCDDNKRSSHNQLRHTLLYKSLVLRIRISRCLVHNHHRRILEHGSGDTDSLTFSTGEMTAGTADLCVISLFQTHDKVMTAGSFCGPNHFLIRCPRFSEADVLLYRQIKKVVILGYVGNLSHVVIQRQLADIHAAVSNNAFVHIPQRINEPCNGTLAGTGRTDDRMNLALPDLHVNTVENLLILVGKLHTMKADVRALRFLCEHCRPLHIFSLQDLRDFPEDRIHFRNVIHIGKSNHQRRHQSGRENNAGDKILRGEAAVFYQQKAHRKNSKERRRHERQRSRLPPDTFPHPSDKAVSSLSSRERKLLVGTSGFSESFDDLNAVDIFHSRVIQILCLLYRHIKLTLTLCHHHRRKNHTDEDRNQISQSHPPVDGEQVDEHYHRQQNIRCKLRYDMSQCRLHGVHSLHNDILVASAVVIQHRSQRNLRKFLAELSADASEHIERRHV